MNENIPDNKTKRNFEDTNETRPLTWWIACIYALSTVALIVACVQAVMHPRVGSLLGMVGPIGMMLYCLGNLGKTDFKLAANPTTWRFPLRILGLCLMAAGPTLQQAYQHKHVGPFIMIGFGTLIVAAVFLLLSILELALAFRSRFRQKQASAGR